MDEGLWTREVNIPTKGIEAADEDALECLLALCRMMGLGYKIDTYKDKYQVRLYWNDLPTDFYVPRKKSGSVGIVNSENVVYALRSAIEMVFTEVVRNGEMFSMLYRQQWKDQTGYDWRDESNG